MSAADKKASGSAPEASYSDNSEQFRISPQGFKALHHLLFAAKHLQAMPDLPGDAIAGARILMTRIDADLIRLGGGK
jgi:hypothetical protein